MDDLEPARRQCVATNRSGARCNRAPIRGGSVCVMHGGGIPHVKQAAKERLLALVEPALDVLLRAMRQAPPCPVCGRSDADRDPVAVRAATVVLDRTGFSPAMTLEVHQTPNTFAGLSLSELADRAEILARTARAAADKEAAARLPAAVDAVIVEHLD